jgi:hypothetical protein
MKPINEMTLPEAVRRGYYTALSENIPTREGSKLIALYDRIQSLTEAQSKREAELVGMLKHFVFLCNDFLSYNENTLGYKAIKDAKALIASSEGKERSIYCQLDENSYCTHCGGHEHLCRQSIDKSECK